MAEIVKWKFDGLFAGDPQKCYEEIGEETVTPEEVLNIAKNEKTELHKCFEWDDTVAANRYRLDQARRIIQSFVIVRQVEKKPQVRAFQITTTTNTYQPTRMFLQQPDEYSDLLARAKAELKAFRERYKMLAELETIFEEIDSL